MKIIITLPHNRKKNVSFLNAYRRLEVIVWRNMRLHGGWETWILINFSIVLFFLSQNLKRNTWKLSRNCKVIDIQSISFQSYENCYNSASPWLVGCELIIRLWIVGRISLHYIKSALSFYIIWSLHVKQSESNTAT